MCKILILIKPKYVDKILSGEKKYEYRKIKPKKNNINKMIIYSTSPVMKVVAEVEVEKIIEDTPENVWKLTKQYSGTTKDLFDKYYHNKKYAVAYKLGKVIIYNKQKSLKDIGINYVPQSFVYMD